MRKEIFERVIMVHGMMLYGCESCGQKFPMYLETGVEDLENKQLSHQPSPFITACPYCGGHAQDLTGIRKTPRRMPLPSGYFYFARDNSAKEDACGIATHYTPMKLRHG